MKSMVAAAIRKAQAITSGTKAMPKDMAVFFDFCSLYQWPRTKPQDIGTQRLIERRRGVTPGAPQLPAMPRIQLP